MTRLSTSLADPTKIAVGTSVTGTSLLRNSSILRVTLSFVGLGIVLWPVRTDSEFVVHPWLTGTLIFGVTLLLFEIILRQSSSDKQTSTWKMVGFSIGCALVFGVAYLVLTVVVNLLGKQVGGEIGLKLQNSITWLHPISFDFGQAFGVSHLVAALITRRERQAKVESVTSDSKRKANSDPEVEEQGGLQNILKIMAVGSGIWVLGVTFLTLYFVTNVEDLFALYEVPLSNTLVPGICSAISVVVTLIILRVFCPGYRRWSSVRLFTPILLISVGHIGSVSAYVLWSSGMVEADSAWIVPELISILWTLVFLFCGVISAFAALNDSDERPPQGSI